MESMSGTSFWQMTMAQRDYSSLGGPATHSANEKKMCEISMMAFLKFLNLSWSSSMNIDWIWVGVASER